MHVCVLGEREGKINYRNWKRTGMNLRQANIVHDKKWGTVFTYKAFGIRFLFNNFHFLFGTQGSGLPESHDSPISSPK